VAQKQPSNDRSDLQSYAEQEQLPQDGGAEEASAQRREADRVEEQRGGAGDPISASDAPVHARSRRGRSRPR
jgi:hypothetical protein